MENNTDPFMTLSDSVKKHLGEIVSLKATVKEKESAISDLTAKNSQLKTSLDKANAEIGSLKTETSELSSKNSELGSQLEQAKADSTALRTEIDELNEKMSEQKKDDT